MNRQLCGVLLQQMQEEAVQTHIAVGILCPFGQDVKDIVIYISVAKDENRYNYETQQIENVFI